MTIYAKISQVAHFVPEQIVTNEMLASIMDTSDEWISSRTGIRKRHITQNQQTSDLAAEVAKQLLLKSGLEATAIDFIIVATITPDSMMPSTAARVQARIGATKAFGFDVTAACAGFTFALSTAEKFIQSGQYQRGLVIGAEVFSKVLDWSDRSTAALFGDGAGGVLVEAASVKHFLAESNGTDGTGGDALSLAYRGLDSPYSEREESRPYLGMNGRAVFEFAVRHVTKDIAALLEKAQVATSEIEYFFLHQANIRILEKMAQKLQVPMEKFPANMMEYGNTSAASIPILLSESVDKGLIRLDGSQTVVLSGFGGGLTWSTILLKL